MARVARAHGVNANQVFQWRRQYSPRVAGSGEHRGGEFASGSCDRSVGRRSGAVEQPRRARCRRAETPDSVGNDPGGTPQGTSSNHRQHRCGIVARGDRVFAAMIGLAAREADLDRGGSDGHAARICRAERDGADGAGAESVFRTGVCVSRQARRSDQVALVGWRRAVLVREAPGARTVHLAAGHQWHRVAHASAVVDVAGRDRLAATGTQLRAADGGVSKIILIFPHIFILL